MDLLLDHMEYVPIEKVVKELERKPAQLYKYLHALFSRDAHLGSEYHGLQVRLYADFDKAKLLPFLKSSSYVPLEEALKICEERGSFYWVGWETHHVPWTLSLSMRVMYQEPLNFVKNRTTLVCGTSSSTNPSINLSL